MRSVSIRIEPERGWFGPVHRGVTESDDLSMDAIHELRLLDDDTLVALYECTGDVEAMDSVLARNGDEEGTYLTKPVGDRVLTYAHRRPCRVLELLVSLPDRWPIVIDWPITFHEDTTACLSLVGERTAVRAVVDALPDDVVSRVDRTGEFRFPGDRILDRLTAREREVLAAACAVGYYENPREATYDDLSDVLDCAGGTVGNHLRNVERKVMQALTNRAIEEAAAPTTDAG